MSSSALLRIDTSKITSFETLLAELSALDSQLGRHQLGNFQTFNTAYHVVTAAIKRAAEANYFANPEFIEEFSVCIRPVLLPGSQRRCQYQTGAAGRMGKNAPFRAPPSSAGLYFVTDGRECPH